MKIEDFEMENSNHKEFLPQRLEFIMKIQILVVLFTMQII